MMVMVLNGNGLMWQLLCQLLSRIFSQQHAVSRMYNQLLSATPPKYFSTGKALSLCKCCAMFAKDKSQFFLPKSHLVSWRHLSDAAVVQGTKLEQVKLKVTSAKITNIQPKGFSWFWCILTLTTVQLWFYHTLHCTVCEPSTWYLDRSPARLQKSGRGATAQKKGVWVFPGICNLQMVTNWGVWYIFKILQI